MQDTIRLNTHLRAAAFCLGSSFVMCMFLQPSTLTAHFGFSYYGNLRATILPFAGGLLAAAYCLSRAAGVLAVDSANQLYWLPPGLRSVAMSMLGLVLTPSLSDVVLLQVAHTVFGLAVFIIAATLSFRYAIWVHGDVLDWSLLACQVLGLLVAGLSFEFLGVLELMLPAQLLAASAFGVLLLRSVRRSCGREGN